jgi:polyferredoxin
MSVNLTKNRMVRSLLKSRWYPALPQALTIWVFAIITWQLLAGPSAADENMGSVFTWVLWWPILPVLFLALGRFWCAICPFGVISDLVQKIGGRNRPVPKFMKKYGIWFIDVMFVLITWADHIFDIFGTPVYTGAMMLAIVTGVVVSGAVWQRRAWCRHLCFLGGLAGNYARNGMMELRATPEICSKCKSKAACYNGNEKIAGCPVFEFPRTMETSANCNLCANCLKTCPNDSIQINLRPPSSEIIANRNPRFDEAFLAIIIMGIVFVKNASDSDVWDNCLKWVGDFVGTGSEPGIGFSVSFTLIFLVAVNIPGMVLTLMSFGAQKLNGDSWKDNLTKFGYALIPLDMAAVIAHTCIDVLSNGKAIGYTAGGLVGVDAGDAQRGFIDLSSVTFVQMAIIVGGAIGSLYAVYRISNFYFGTRGHTWRTILPYGFMITVFAAINIYIYALGHPTEDAPSGVTYVADGFSLPFNLGVIISLLIIVSAITVWVRTPKRKSKKGRALPMASQASAKLPSGSAGKALPMVTADRVVSLETVEAARETEADQQAV